MQIVISEFMDGDAVSKLRAAFDVLYDPSLVDRRDDLLDHLAAADALIVRNRTRVDRALLGRAPKLRVVGRLGVGLDNIDVNACRDRSVRVMPATGANADAVAEYVILAAMFLLRGLGGSTAAVAEGRWPRAALSDGRELAGKTLGIVGFGSIGRRVAALARALGMSLLAHDAMLPPADDGIAAAGAQGVTLHELLSRADVVTLHVPLDDRTRHLIDADAIRLMKGNAVLINTARGGIVDEAALVTALQEGRLGGAAVDVYAAEPLTAGSVFANCPRVLLTPHIAGVTAESNVRVSTMIADRVAAALDAG